MNPNTSGQSKKNVLKKIGGIIFTVLCAALLWLFYSLIFRRQENISIEENRTLQKVPAFTFADFAAGKFQEEMENSISDQMLFSKEIKYGVKQFYNGLTALTAELDFKTEKQKTVLAAFGEPDIANEIESNADPVQDEAVEIEQPDKNCYTYKEVVAGKLYKLDDSGYIVEKARAPEEYEFKLYDSAMLSQITFPKYLYFIETPQSADFNDLKKYNAFDYIKKQMPEMDGYDMLRYNSFDEYKNLFYQTDHHWNYKGSYTGYTQIMRMLEGDDVELLKPKGCHTYNTVYNGSYARDNLLKCATEKFTVYEFDIPPYKTYVNDRQKEYGYRSYYVSDDDFPHKTYSNHYGMYYGDDWAKVVYDFEAPEKENLLILGTSFTNAVNELIASHYNKTHILDFRHYRKQYGENINAQKYMEKNNISKVVIIGHLTSLGYRK